MLSGVDITGFSVITSFFFVVQENAVNKAINTSKGRRGNCIAGEGSPSSPAGGWSMGVGVVVKIRYEIIKWVRIQEEGVVKERLK